MKNLKNANISRHVNNYNNFFARISPLKTIAPEVLNISCIRLVTEGYYDLITNIEYIQTHEDIKEKYLEKEKFIQYITALDFSLETIKQIALFTQDEVTNGIEITEFGPFMEIMCNFVDLLCEITEDSKETNGLIHRYLAAKPENKKNIDVLWKELNDIRKG